MREITSFVCVSSSSLPSSDEVVSSNKFSLLMLLWRPWLLLEKFGEFFVMLRKLPLLSELEVTSSGILILLALLLFDVSL